jgi:septum formation protein
MKIVLGSSSHSRQEIMKEIGLPFEVVPANIDEKAIRLEDPYALVQALARAKAEAVRAKLVEPSILIASDQVIVCDGKILEKPESKEEAVQFLKAYAQFPAEAVYALVMINTETGERRELVEKSSVFFRPFPPELIEKLVSEDEAYARAGGFGVEDPRLEPYIERIAGDKKAIMGLPKERVEQFLKELGA